MFDSFFNTIFSPILGLSPAASLLIISLILTTLTTIAYKYTTDQKFLKEIKEEINLINKEVKELKDNPQKVMEKQKVLWEKNLKIMGHTLKSSIYTLIPLLIIFTWLRSFYQPQGDILFGLSWIWVYILSSIVFSMIIRKVLKIH
ncbi:DUF106 domain-containing protein [Candidatus Woesearchaeota archaeon]|nr:DUF106 domain-containing protein [Candidatus Woesearchaeota archaeon]